MYSSSVCWFVWADDLVTVSISVICKCPDLVFVSLEFQFETFAFRYPHNIFLSLMMSGMSVPSVIRGLSGEL